MLHTSFGLRVVPHTASYKRTFMTAHVRQYSGTTTSSSLTFSHRAMSATRLFPSASHHATVYLSHTAHRLQAVKT